MPRHSPVTLGMPLIELNGVWPVTNPMACSSSQTICVVARLRYQSLCADGIRIEKTVQQRHYRNFIGTDATGRMLWATADGASPSTNRSGTPSADTASARNLLSGRNRGRSFHFRFRCGWKTKSRELYRHRYHWDQFPLQHQRWRCD